MRSRYVMMSFLSKSTEKKEKKKLYKLSHTKSMQCNGCKKWQRALEKIRTIALLNAYLRAIFTLHQRHVLPALRNP